MSSRWKRILGSVGLAVGLAWSTAGCQSCTGESAREETPPMKPEEKARLRGIQRLKVVRPEFVGDGAAVAPPTEASAAPSAAPTATPSAPAPSASH